MIAPSGSFPEGDIYVASNIIGPGTRMLTTTTVINRRDMDFLLRDWLDVGALLKRPRFVAYDMETVATTLDLAQKIAENEIAPHLLPGNWLLPSSAVTNGAGISGASLSESHPHDVRISPC
jgi:hypothetical protein